MGVNHASFTASRSTRGGHRFHFPGVLRGTLYPNTGLVLFQGCRQVGRRCTEFGSVVSQFRSAATRSSSTALMAAYASTSPKEVKSYLQKTYLDRNTNMNSAPSGPDLGSSGGSLILDVGDGALRVEILKIAAFGTRSRVDNAADERRFSRGQSVRDSLRKTLWIGYVLPGPAKCFDKLLATRVPYQEEIKAKELYAASPWEPRLFPNDSKTQAPAT
jgi:hypothetical protein